MNKVRPVQFMNHNKFTLIAFSTSRQNNVLNTKLSDGSPLDGAILDAAPFSDTLYVNAQYIFVASS